VGAKRRDKIGGGGLQKQRVRDDCRGVCTTVAHGTAVGRRSFLRATPELLAALAANHAAHADEARAGHGHSENCVATVQLTRERHDSD